MRPCRESCSNFMSYDDACAPKEIPTGYGHWISLDMIRYGWVCIWPNGTQWDLVGRLFKPHPSLAHHEVRIHGTALGADTLDFYDQRGESVESFKILNFGFLGWINGE